MSTQIFKFQTTENTRIAEIMTFEQDDTIWFAATDVCKVLGLSNTTEMLRNLDEDEKLTSVILRAGQRRKINLINESGLYALILKSRKQSAQLFRKWITKEVIPSIRKNGFYGKAFQNALPTSYLRFQQNYNQVDRNYFSVINEMFLTLNVEFEKKGYQLPTRSIDGKELCPDISVGQTFATYLKSKGYAFAVQAKTYKHTFPDGREVEAKMYPLEALAVFRRFMYEEWIPNYAFNYFRKRAPEILGFWGNSLGK